MEYDIDMQYTTAVLLNALCDDRRLRCYFQGWIENFSDNYFLKPDNLTLSRFVIVDIITLCCLYLYVHFEHCVYLILKYKYMYLQMYLFYIIYVYYLKKRATSLFINNIVYISDD